MKKSIYNYLIILLVSIVLTLPLFIGNNYIDGHDTGFHVANIDATSKVLSLNTPKVLPLIGNDFGYGTGIFYPRMSHLIAASLVKIGFNVITSINIICFLVFFLSGIFMYQVTNKISKSNLASLLSSIFYITFPYFMSDIFIRFAFAESMMLPLIPLTFLSIFYLFDGNKKKFYILFVTTFVLMINFHLITTFYFTFLLLIFLLVNFKTTKKYLKDFIIASLFIIGLSLPSVVPMLEHKFLGNYMVFYKDAMFNNDWASSYSLSTQLIEYFSKESINFTINVVLIGLFIYAIILFKKKKINNKFIFGIIIVSLAALLLSSKLFPWFIVPKIFTIIQFPWRLFMFVAFGFSIISSISLTHITKKKTLFIILSIFLVNTIISLNYVKIKQFDEGKTNYNDGLGWKHEYLPVNIERYNYNYFENRNKEISSDCKANIKVDDSNFYNYKVTVSNLENNCKIEVPRIYYLTYKLVFEDGEKLKYYENYKGFIEYEVTKEGTYSLVYQNTFLTKISQLVFVITLISGIMVMSIYDKRSKNGRIIEKK